MAGGGFAAGATGESYRAFRDQVRAYISDLSPSDQAKIFGGTAAKLFAFGSR